LSRKTEVDIGCFGMPVDIIELLTLGLEYNNLQERVALKQAELVEASVTAARADTHQVASSPEPETLPELQKQLAIAKNKIDAQAENLNHADTLERNFLQAIYAKKHHEADKYAQELIAKLYKKSLDEHLVPESLLPMVAALEKFASDNETSLTTEEQDLKKHYLQLLKFKIVAITFNSPALQHKFAVDLENFIEDNDAAIIAIEQYMGNRPQHSSDTFAEDALLQRAVTSFLRSSEVRDFYIQLPVVAFELINNLKRQIEAIRIHRESLSKRIILVQPMDKNLEPMLNQTDSFLRRVSEILTPEIDRPLEAHLEQLELTGLAKEQYEAMVINAPLRLMYAFLAEYVNNNGVLISHQNEYGPAFKAIKYPSLLDDNTIDAGDPTEYRKSLHAVFLAREACIKIAPRINEFCKKYRDFQVPQYGSWNTESLQQWQKFSKYLETAEKWQGANSSFKVTEEDKGTCRTIIGFLDAKQKYDLELAIRQQHAAGSRPAP
jgi:hypothetical protein